MEKIFKKNWTKEKKKHVINKILLIVIKNFKEYTDFV